MRLRGVIRVGKPCRATCRGQCGYFLGLEPQLLQVKADGAEFSQLGAQRAASSRSALLRNVWFRRVLHSPRFFGTFRAIVRLRMKNP